MKSNSKFKHLTPSSPEMVKNGCYYSTIPRPAKYSTKKVGILRHTVHTYVCGCDKIFASHEAYALHYRSEQMIELEAKLMYQRDLAREKAKYWRRATVIYQYGTTTEMENFERCGKPTMVDLAEMKFLNEKVATIWSPIYIQASQKWGVTLGEFADEEEITDDDPEAAAQEIEEILEEQHETTN